MKHIPVIFSIVVVIGAISQSAHSQTKCVWIDQSKDGRAVGRIAVSIDLVRVLAKPGSEVNLDGTQLSYDTLLYAYNEDEVLKVSDGTGTRQSRVYGGKFGLPMKKSMNDRHYLVLENTDSNGVVTFHKLRVESIEAAAVIIATLNAGDFDDDLDKINSVFKPGGMLFIKDLRDGSSVWIYVN